MTITINNTYFVKTEKELVDSLFNKGGTAAGTYKNTKKTILFFNGNGDLFAAMVKRGDNSFFVNASIQNGKKRFMFGTSENTERMLGISKNSFSEKNKIAVEVLQQVN